MTTLKRRPLGGNKSGQQAPAQPRQPQQQAPTQPRGPQQNKPQQGGRPQQQQNRRPQPQQNNNQQQRHHHNRNRQPPRPPKPVAYLQRDVLLIVAQTDSEKLNEVRTKFDPLVKKLPAHITLVLPEPAQTINDQFLELPEGDVKTLGELTFTDVTVFDERYLWLVPDQESSEKIKTFRNQYVSKMTSHTQGEEFDPHLSLGYVPRKTQPEDAIAFAKGILNFPLTLKFNKLLLEEFEENQISKTIKEIQI